MGEHGNGGGRRRRVGGQQLLNGGPERTLPTGVLALTWALVGFAAFASPAAAQGDGGGGGAVFALLFWLAIGVGVSYFLVRNRSPFQLSTTTSAAPEEVIERIERDYTMKGWSVASKRTDAVTFQYNRRPSCLWAILLFLLGLIPGIVYLVIGNRLMTTDVQARAGGAGTRVDLSSNTRGFESERLAKAVLASLPGSSVALPAP